MIELTTEQLLEQLRLQHKLNCIVDPKWVTAHYHWHIAAMMEAAELLDHIGWKWWKATPELDIQQIRLELVDIWHFKLSQMLVEHHGDAIKAAVKLDSVLRANSGVSMGSPVKYLIVQFIKRAADGIIDLDYLRPLLVVHGITGESLHQMYMQKNVLNLFRQANGYKDGTYVKTWHGQEDNQVLANYTAAHPDATADQLMSFLDRTYATLNPNQLEIPCAST